MVNDSVTIKDVISYYNIIGLGVGVAIGIAGKDLVFSLANDIITPLFVKIFGGKNLINNNKLDIQKFISALITFVIILSVIIFVLYIVLRPMVREDINSDKEYKETVQNDLSAIITYQKDISKNTKPVDNIVSHQQNIEENTGKLAKSMY